MRSKRELPKTGEKAFQRQAPTRVVHARTGKLEPPYKSFVNLNFKVDDWFAQRFGLEAKLRSLTNKELLEAAFKAYFEKNGGTMEKPRQDLVERFVGKRTNTRRSRGHS